MKTLKFIAAIAVASVVSTSASAASLLWGKFDVEIRSYDAGGSSTNAQASEANEAANAVDAIGTYTGFLDFNVGQPQTAAYTIDQWLSTGTGTFTYSSGASVGGNQLSFPTMRATTMFTFKTNYAQAFDFEVRHDDGMQAFDDGTSILKSLGPNSVKTTGPASFDGGDFKLIYVAANGNPSILEVTGTAGNIPEPVPLPASALLLLAGVGVLGAKARRKAA